MVKFTHSLPIIVMLVAAGLAAPQPASAAQSRAEHGDNLLIHRVQQEKDMNLPRRGLSMSQVEKAYGVP